MRMSVEEATRPKRATEMLAEATHFKCKGKGVTDAETRKPMAKIRMVMKIPDAAASDLLRMLRVFDHPLPWL
jgi:hypothetical protein